MISVTWERSSRHLPQDQGHPAHAALCPPQVDLDDGDLLPPHQRRLGPCGGWDALLGKAEQPSNRHRRYRRIRRTPRNRTPHSWDCRGSHRRRCRRIRQMCRNHPRHSSARNNSCCTFLRTRRASHNRGGHSWACRRSQTCKSHHTRQMCRSLVVRSWGCRGSRTCRPRHTHLNLHTGHPRSSGHKRNQCCSLRHTRQGCHTPHPSMSGCKASLQRGRCRRSHYHLRLKRYPKPGRPAEHFPSRVRAERP